MLTAQDLEPFVKLNILSQNRVSQMLRIAEILNDEGEPDDGALVRPGVTSEALGRIQDEGSPDTRKKARAKRGSFNPTKEELIQLRTAGATAKEIGMKFGVSAGTVALKLKSFGLTTPRAKK